MVKFTVWMLVNPKLAKQHSVTVTTTQEVVDEFRTTFKKIWKAVVDIRNYAKDAEPHDPFYDLTDINTGEVNSVCIANVTLMKVEQIKEK